MRDRLGRGAWWNQPLKNPTQSRYRRFVKMPYTGLKTRFTDSQDEFKNKLRDALKTRYNILEEESND